MPAISYAGGGHRGVTHLVAIGDTEDALTVSTENKVAVAGVGLAAVGMVAGSKRAFWGGAGVAAGILIARWWRSRRTVVVTQPATAPQPTAAYW